MELVSVSYEDLLAGNDVTEKILQAYGPGGLGALTISGIPEYSALRMKLLPLSHKLAHLPDDRKAILEHEPSMWNAGWSHGKEKLGDKPDFAKGSFYANPLYDDAATPEEKEKYPFFSPKNIWPSEDIPELEVAFKNLGKVMYEAVLLLSKQIDKLVSKHIPTYNGKLYQEMSQTKKLKGRLLYYYPTDKVASEDGWIGWHNDSGFLTALSGDIYFNDETGEQLENPDPKGGLWIIDRNSGSVKVSIPSDHLAVQCGECLQIITGGLLVATPHCVKASASPVRIGRASFPVFIDTTAVFPLSAPSGVTNEQVFDKTVKSRVPPLEKRWTGNGQPFIDFLGTTFSQYYEWTKSLQSETPEK